MREVSWVALLRHIPPEQQDGLMLITKGRTEITINNFLRIDHEFVAFRGRLAGSQEAGRLFVVPYDNIDYLGTQKPIKDSEYQEIYGNLVMPEPLPAADERAAAPAAAPPPVPARTHATIKSAVLERFRSRSGSSPLGVVSRPPSEG